MKHCMPSVGAPHPPSNPFLAQQQEPHDPPVEEDPDATALPSAQALDGTGGQQTKGSGETTARTIATARQQKGGGRMLLFHRYATATTPPPPTPALAAAAETTVTAVVRDSQLAVEAARMVSQRATEVEERFRLVAGSGAERDPSGGEEGDGTDTKEEADTRLPLSRTTFRSTMNKSVRQTFGVD
ncbi:hypothetical protein STCU_10614 [Strigomonas culicis]|uniref:Uncharacterized protein n=1 Tax=Strigomonas culicis TaxID=28005 RepID=S9US71_9TRYP|nr:hypothetical protein STCU_10614 [Strigomonas culicis]|eukprot:EPY17441.1 hypothetical protein STCU_10614 [Strigomonas culicis]